MNPHNNMTNSSHYNISSNNIIPTGTCSNLNTKSASPNDQFIYSSPNTGRTPPSSLSSFPQFHHHHQHPYMQQQRMSSSLLHTSIPAPTSSRNVLIHNQHFSASPNNPGFQEGTNPTMNGIHKSTSNPVSSLDLSNANVVDLSMHQLLQLSNNNSVVNNINNNNNTSTTTIGAANNIGASSSSLMQQQQQQQHASLYQSLFNNNQQQTQQNLQRGIGNNNSFPINNTSTQQNCSSNDTEAMLRLLLNNPSLLESSTFDLHIGNIIPPHQQQSNFDTKTENDLTINMGKDSTIAEMQENHHSGHFSYSDIFDVPPTMRSSSSNSSQHDSFSETSTNSSSLEKMEGHVGASEKKSTGKRGDSGGVKEATIKRKRRSIKERLMWSDELHQHFVQVVESLGVYEARPKEIKKIMNVDFLTTTHIKSHLQKYRTHLKKRAERDGTQLPPLKRSNGSSSSPTKSKKEPKRKKKKTDKEDVTTPTSTTPPSASTSVPQQTYSSIQSNTTSTNVSLPSTTNSPSLPPNITSNESAVFSNNPVNIANSPPHNSLFDPQYLTKIFSHLDKPLVTKNSSTPQHVSPINNFLSREVQPITSSPKSATKVSDPLELMHQRRNSQPSNNSNNSQLNVNSSMNMQNINFGNVQSLLTNSSNSFQRINDNSLGYVDNNFVTMMDSNVQMPQNTSARNSNSALGDYLKILRNICSSEKEFADLFQNIQSQIREPKDMDLVVEGFRLGFLCGHRIQNNK